MLNYKKINQAFTKFCKKNGRAFVQKKRDEVYISTSRFAIQLSLVEYENLLQPLSTLWPALDDEDSGYKITTAADSAAFIKQKSDFDISCLFNLVDEIKLTCSPLMFYGDKDLLIFTSENGCNTSFVDAELFSALGISKNAILEEAFKCNDEKFKKHEYGHSQIVGTIDGHEMLFMPCRIKEFSKFEAAVKTVNNNL